MGMLSSVMKSTSQVVSEAFGGSSSQISEVLSQGIGDAMARSLRDIHPTMENLFKDLSNFLQRSGINDQTTEIPDVVLRATLNKPDSPMGDIQKLMQQLSQMQSTIQSIVDEQHKLTEQVIKNLR